MIKASVPIEPAHAHVPSGQLGCGEAMRANEATSNVPNDPEGQVRLTQMVSVMLTARSRMVMLAWMEPGSALNTSVTITVK